MQTLNNVLKSKNNEYFLSCIIWKEVLKGKLSALEIGHVTDMLDRVEAYPVGYRSRCFVLVFLLMLIICTFMRDSRCFRALYK